MSLRTLSYSRSAFRSIQGGQGVPGQASLVSDSNFPYVSLLLHGDGTNNATNSTIIDSSTNNLTVTAGGTPAQGTGSPYSQTGWSMAFNGSTDYLSTSSSASFLPGTSPFTVEAWVYLTASPSVEGQIWGRNTYGSSSDYVVTVKPTRVVGIYFNSTVTYYSNSTTIPIGIWTHIAVIRDGASVTVYVNGVGQTTSISTSASANNTGTGNWTIGASNNSNSYFPGYISNLRMVNGTAIYTSAFIPPASPLSAISGTVLLTLQSNRIIDNSTNNFALTASGTPSIQAASPFEPASDWSSSINSGSIYFNGSTDYLTIPTGTTSLQFGSGDFTVEAWVYLNSTASTQVVFTGQSDANTAAGSSTVFYVAGTTVTSDIYVGSSSFAVTSPKPTSKTWAHVAWVRNGSTFSSYLNGTLVQSVACSGSINAGASTYPNTIGRAPTGTRYLDGYISNLRVVKGTAVYTSAFTPPVTPLTAITNTSMLLSGTNSAIYDSTTKNNLLIAGDTKTMVSVNKFGGSSIYFDGTGDYITMPSNVAFQFGTSDFTVEGWFYPTSIANNGVIQISSTVGGLQANNTTNVAISVVSGQLSIYAASATYTGSSIAANTWYNVAVVRNSGVTKVYLNGSLITSFGISGAITDTTNYAGTYCVVGGYSSTATLWNGYLDDIRITKGIARYTTNFVPPNSPFPNR